MRLRQLAEDDMITGALIGSFFGAMIAALLSKNLGVPLDPSIFISGVGALAGGSIGTVLAKEL